MTVQVFVADLTIDRATKTPLVILQEHHGQRQLPICIGLMEASAIAAAKEGLELPRPMTHDLLANVLSAMAGQVHSIVITELDDGTFYALLNIQCTNRMIEIDSRPSDAIALALRTGSPIYVSELVMQEAAVQTESSDRWAEFLEGLDPDDFGKYKM